MNNNLHSERRKSIFYVFQPLVYTNKEEEPDKKEHDYNIDFDKEILKRTKKKKRRISFIKKYLGCSFFSKTEPKIQP